jgi:hypothetical protein
MSNKIVLVTTTINQPTVATLKFCALVEQNENWHMVVIGDTKTPHDLYRQLEQRHKNFIYLSPDEQYKLYPELSNIIGWNCIQRRNIGFVYAINELDADIVATIDDDNIPYENWGKNIYVNTTVLVDHYINNNHVYFDPFSVTNQKQYWHRGYPVQHIKTKNDITFTNKISMDVLVQADFWDGDPDVDAICRLTNNPIVKFDKFDMFCTNQIAPFNSQNTFLSKKIIQEYAVLPYLGRMDDIWGGYMLYQTHTEPFILFHPATVYQERNIQCPIKNLENEIIGYRHTKDFIDFIVGDKNSDPYNFPDFVPDKTKLFIEIYRNTFNK